MTIDSYLRRPRNFYPNPPYGAYEFIRGLNLKNDQKILLVGEARSFYAPSGVIGNAPYDVPVVYEWADQNPNNTDFLAKLKSEKVSVILISKAEGRRNDSALYFNSQNQGLIAAILQSHFKKVYEDNWTIVFNWKT